MPQIYKGFTIPAYADAANGPANFASFADSCSPLAISISSQTASYTLALADAGTQVEFNSASAGVFTVPTDASVAFPVGSTILLVQAGVGQLSVANTSPNPTVNGTPGLKLRTQWSSAVLVKRGSNLWLLSGDVVA